MPTENEQELRPEEELQLTQAVMRGDPEALERFHGYLCTPLYRFVFFRLEGVRTDTEEIVQESFLAALESLHRFRGRSSLLTWICAIAKNHISKSRRRRRRERLADVLESADPEIEAALRDLEQAELPDEVLEREETRDLVGATMASLPLPYQSILTEKYVDSMSVKDMATRRRSTPKAVESTLTRARVAFRRVFELLARRVGGEVGDA